MQKNEKNSQITKSNNIKKIKKNRTESIREFELGRNQKLKENRSEQFAKIYAKQKRRGVIKSIDLLYSLKNTNHQKFLLQFILHYYYYYIAAILNNLRQMPPKTPTKRPKTERPKTKRPQMKRPQTKRPQTKQPLTKRPQTKKTLTKNPQTKKIPIYSENKMSKVAFS